MIQYKSVEKYIIRTEGTGKVMELFRKIMAIILIVMMVSASTFTLVYFLINYVF